ncbi:hypothetical protein BDW62DRAFT_174402 [Aspergillus aurantiobrunneus]
MTFVRFLCRRLSPAILLSLHIRSIIGSCPDPPIPEDCPPRTPVGSVPVSRSPGGWTRLSSLPDGFVCAPDSLDFSPFWNLDPPAGALPCPPSD